MTGRIALMLLLIVPFTGSAQDYTLTNVSYNPGQKLFVGLAGEPVGAPLKILVQDKDGNPVPNVDVIFEIVEKPSKAHGEMLGQRMVQTDTLGIAVNTFTLGDYEGDYVIIAHAKGMTDDTPTILVRAQKSLWWLFVFIGLFGGLGIFLFGMSMGSNGLQKAAGSKLRDILQALTSNRFAGLFVGIGITAIVQSSSATSVMVVGLVSSALMTLQQAIGVLMGAHIGTTITVQLIAFNISDYALLLVGGGFVMTLVTKRKFYIYIGEIILGFGFIFFGMAVMSQAISPLKSMPAFQQWLIGFATNPVLGILASAAFTAIIQSSGATIGLCVVMASEGLLSFESAMPLVFGANIGTCVTALLSAIGAPTSGKRTAVAHTMFSVFGVIVFTPFLEPFESLVIKITHWIGGDTVARLIANGHMLFNIMAALILIGFVPVFARIIIRMVPEKKTGDDSQPKYLNNAYLETPEIALQQAQLEEARLIERVRSMFEDVKTLHKVDNETEIARLKQKMQNVVSLEFEIRRYLARLSQKNISLTQSKRLMRILLTIDDLRHMSNRIGDDIGGLLEKLADAKLTLSGAVKSDFDRFYTVTGERLGRIFAALEKEDKDAAAEFFKTKHASSELETKLRQAQFDRISEASDQELTVSSIYLDLLTSLKRLDTFAAKIAHEIVEQFQF